MKKAIQFGAGNIGRGFIGALLSQASYHVVFADINEQMINELNEKKSYQIHILDLEQRQETITNVSGVLSNGPDIINELAEADFVTTAVGPNVLKIIASTIAKGIEARREAGRGILNIIACENMVGGSKHLEEQVYSHLSEEGKSYAKDNVGFANCSVDRIVPPYQGDNILDVGVESFYEWIVEEPSLKGEAPQIPGMKLTDNLLAYVQRKLFTLNTGHAITAYLGYLDGIETIEEAINNDSIRKVVRQAMEESGDALIKKHGFDKEEHYKYIDKIEKRFKNPYIRDEVIRVGREPLRKLGPADRLVGPANIAIDYGLPHEALLKGIAAAFHYDNSQDLQSKELQGEIAEKGIEAVVSSVTGFAEGSEDYRIICEQYAKTSKV
ncbi:mannitol-1-phosphate 5-dehydrogenase [Paenibacillus macquariensis]|uniref:Mannitol-1-phosphate 5-dehydrogenase n=1 Tax=Paenibacillus macquariensis TaxID=948756 RepID=A0ABY1JPM9_9BACL|nr:mannitol-1-phosphate 5-dehydrogenase [Paenibacillus macquariensis]MEC0091943.1 mannitol-1-phosphate 5-dehydrogenase [Paenibacillus macquariensis]OAB37482.1 mannitol-1-phosphate 5-dehydrogenase [Paenibacillus macquariensis subsp. macquariensis]SIQ54366.1 mannitol-1-phosphate 5-dehydrogenase [Paenibacillus macquariensis]